VVERNAETWAITEYRAGEIAIVEELGLRINVNQRYAVLAAL